MKNSKSNYSPVQHQTRTSGRQKSQKERRAKQRELARNANKRFMKANPFVGVELDASLPIYKNREMIVGTVNRNQITIVSAETGSGKSTQVPLMLLKAGYERITVAVPSRTAAMSLASRVAFQTGSELGKLVGYETGYEKCAEPETKILYTTQGMQLMHELRHTSGSPKRVLIIDECQDWNVFTETLVAWTKHRVGNGWKSKVLLMSASADTQALSTYFNAPVLHSEGRTFEISMHIDEEKHFLDNICKYAKTGKKVLAFVPGKREIDETIQALQARKLDACILPMHGELAMDEQQLVYMPTTLPKVIVSTNVAQASITIPDIDVVIDTGLERNLVELDGLTSLALRPISQSDLFQRMGRAGRTKEGIYVYCGENAIQDLQEYPTPDIYAEPIDNIVLRLATADIDPHNLKFFHQPPIEKIESAQKTLRILGALDENNKITETGRIMATLPITSQHARMLVEAEKRGVLADVITIVAIQEFGGLKQPNVSYSNFGVDTRSHSDLLAELDVFNHVQMLIHKGASDAFKGIMKRNFFRVLELRTKLYDVLYEQYEDIDSTGNQHEILMSCAAGYVEHLYIRGDNNWYTNPNDMHKRKLDLYSLSFPTKYVLGLPKNIQLSQKQDGYEETLYLILHGVGFNDVEKLKQLAPHLVKQLPAEDCYDISTNSYYRRTAMMFGDVEIGEEIIPITTRKERVDILANWLANSTAESESYEFSNENNGLYEVFKTAQTTVQEQNLSRNEVSDFFRNILTRDFCGDVPNLRKPKSVQNLLDAIKFQKETVCC